MNDHTPAMAATLNNVASRLQAVGFLHPDLADPYVQIKCLASAEHLRVAGAEIRPVTLPGPLDVETVIRGALAELAGLPAEVFALDHILDASFAARAAVDELQAQ
jgi:hypothetical protein